MNSKIVSYISKNKQEDSNNGPWMEKYRMENYVKRYTDNLIREYKTNTVDDLPKSEKVSLVGLLYEKDPAVAEMLDNYIDEIIKARFDWVESQDNYAKGLTPVHDSQTGDVMWVRR